MFAIHGHLLPTARSYTDVEALYNRLPVMPDESRGLRSKRDFSKRLVKNGAEYQFIFHRTAMVFWHPDKIVARTYDTRSSVIFADRFLPSGIDAVSVRGEMYYRLDGKHYMQKDHRGVVFNLVDGRWQVDPSTVMTFTTKTLDKSRAARVRKMMKPFMDWMKSVDRLRGEPHLLDSNYRRAVDVLREVVKEDIIPTEAYRRLSEFALFRNKEMMRILYQATDCVDTVELPFGSVRRNSPYGGI